MRRRVAVRRLGVRSVWHLRPAATLGSQQRTKPRRTVALQGSRLPQQLIRGHGDRPPHGVHRRLHDVEAHRSNGCEALDLEPRSDAMNHVARGQEGRTPRHHIVDEHDSFEVGSEVTTPPKRSTEGGDGWPLTARGTMCLWNRLGPYLKLLNVAPQNVLMKDIAKAEYRPERVFRPPRRAARNGHQRRVGSEDALELKTVDSRSLHRVAIRSRTSRRASFTQPMVLLGRMPVPPTSRYLGV